MSPVRLARWSRLGCSEVEENVDEESLVRLAVAGGVDREGVADNSDQTICEHRSWNSTLYQLVHSLGKFHGSCRAIRWRNFWKFCDTVYYKHFKGDVPDT
jgi:hypothetical protein